MSPAIDVHGHYGAYVRENSAALQNDFMSATAPEVAARAGACGVAVTIVSPLAALLPRGKADTYAANEAAFRVNFPPYPDCFSMSW